MKRNVLLLTGSFHQGGTERQVVQLTKMLAESSRYNLHLACLSGEGVLRGEVEHLGLDIPVFPLTSFYDRNTVKQVRRFASLLRERRIDLIHAYDFYTNVFGMMAATLARVPVRLTSRRETDGLRTAAQKWAERRAFSLSHGVVTNAEAVRRQLIRDGVPADKVVTIYNGVDMNRVIPKNALSREAALALLGLSREKERRFVSIVANMRHAMKDQPTFLRAAKRVKSAVPEVAFVLAGEGELMEENRALARELDLGESAFFIGRCANVPALLGISEVCVLSSSGVEGFSNSIIEYMAAARPVVATDVGGAAEAVVDGHTGYIVAPGDEETMADRIISLLKHPERACQMGEAGMQIIKQKFSLETQIASIQALYDRLLVYPGAPLREVAKNLRSEGA